MAEDLIEKVTFGLDGGDILPLLQILKYHTFLDSSPSPLAPLVFPSLSGCKC